MANPIKDHAFYTSYISNGPNGELEPLIDFNKGNDFINRQNVEAIMNPTPQGDEGATHSTSIDNGADIIAQYREDLTACDMHYDAQLTKYQQQLDDIHKQRERLDQSNPEHKDELERLGVAFHQANQNFLEATQESAALKANMLDRLATTKNYVVGNADKHFTREEIRALMGVSVADANVQQSLQEKCGDLLKVEADGHVSLNLADQRMDVHRDKHTEEMISSSRYELTHASDEIQKFQQEVMPDAPALTIASRSDDASRAMPDTPGGPSATPSGPGGDDASPAPAPSVTPTGPSSSTSTTSSPVGTGPSIVSDPSSTLADDFRERTWIPPVNMDQVPEDSLSADFFNHPYMQYFNNQVSPTPDPGTRLQIDGLEVQHKGQTISSSGFGIPDQEVQAYADKVAGQIEDPDASKGFQKAVAAHQEMFALRYKEAIALHQQNIVAFEQRANTDPNFTSDKMLAHMKANEQNFANQMQLLDNQYGRFVVNLEKAAGYANEHHRVFKQETGQSMNQNHMFLLLEPTMADKDASTAKLPGMERNQEAQADFKQLMDYDKKNGGDLQHDASAKRAGKSHSSEFERSDKYRVSRPEPGKSGLSDEKKELNEQLRNIAVRREQDRVMFEAAHKKHLADRKVALLQKSNMRKAFIGQSLNEIAREYNRVPKNKPFDMMTDCKAQGDKSQNPDHTFRLKNGFQVRTNSEKGHFSISIKHTQPVMSNPDAKGHRRHIRNTKMSNNQRKEFMRQSLAELHRRGAKTCYCASTNPAVVRQFYKEARLAGFEAENIKLYKKTRGGNQVEMKPDERFNREMVLKDKHSKERYEGQDRRVMIPREYAKDRTMCHRWKQSSTRQGLYNFKRKLQADHTHSKIDKVEKKRLEQAEKTLKTQEQGMRTGLEQSRDQRVDMRVDTPTTPSSRGPR